MKTTEQIIALIAKKKKERWKHLGSKNGESLGCTGCVLVKHFEICDSGFPLCESFLNALKELAQE